MQSTALLPLVTTVVAIVTTAVTIVTDTVAISYHCYTINQFQLIFSKKYLLIQWRQIIHHVGFFFVHTYDSRQSGFLMTFKNLRYGRDGDRESAVSWHSDWMRNGRALYDWSSRFPWCRAVTGGDRTVFVHTHTKSALCLATNYFQRITYIPLHMLASKNQLSIQRS
jgi:hypothetical protein